MRRTAVMLAGATALGALLGSAALAGGSTAHADGTSAVPAPKPAAAGHAEGVPRAPKGGCKQEPQEAPTVKQVPYQQRMFGTERVWPISTGKGVTVAVLDSGVDTSHPHLDGDNIGSGADFYRGNGGGSGTKDCDGHGTAVASLIAGQKVKGVGLRGLAYNAKILPVVVADEFDEEEDQTKVTSASKLARAINWAVNHDADVINISVTITEDSSAVEEAIANAIENDVVVVAAVGNRAVPGKAKDGDAQKPEPGPETYPAAYDGVIGVGAVGPADDGMFPPLDNSGWAGNVDIAAPGGSILAANRGGGHIAVTGNGYATPFVSAAAALVRAKWPDLSADEVARRLYATASPAAGPRAKVGHGLVDPYRALTEGLSDEAPVAHKGVKPPSLGPAAAARAKEREFHGTVALIGGTVGVFLAVVMLATLTLLPKGKRRKWRPGRAKPIPEREEKTEDGLPPAPVKLFEDLETT